MGFIGSDKSGKEGSKDATKDGNKDGKEGSKDGGDRPHSSIERAKKELDVNHIYNDLSPYQYHLYKPNDLFKF